MMIRKFKSGILQYRVLLENFSFLSVLQLSNLLIFLFITPYLFRVLGKQSYGLVVFAQTVAAYFSILVNFGFNITATRDISVNRDDSEKSSKIISTVLTLKGLLFLLSVLILCILVIFIPLLNEHPQVFFYSLIFTLGETIFPIWFFLGLERMRYIAIINVITRVLSACLIFFFVKNPGDYMKVPLMLGFGTIIGAVIGLNIIFRKYHNKFLLIPFHELLVSMKENVPMFISNVSTQIYVNANKLIVGSFLGMQDVAIYDIADKIVTLLKVPIQLLGQTLFPRISYDKNVKFIKKTMILVLIFYILIYLGVNMFAGFLINLFSGSTNASAELLLRILALSILPICIGLFFAELLLIPFGKLKEYARMRTFSLILYLLTIGFMVRFSLISLNNLAYTIVFVESFVFLYSYYLCRKSKLV